MPLQTCLTAAGSDNMFSTSTPFPGPKRNGFNIMIHFCAASSETLDEVTPLVHVKTPPLAPQPHQYVNYDEEQLNDPILHPGTLALKRVQAG